MKKTFWAATGLVLIGAVTAVFLLTNLHDKLNQVTMTEETIYGDISAAKGLTAQQNVSMGENLHWTETVSYGDTVTSEVKYYRSNEPDAAEMYNPDPDGLYLMTTMNGYTYYDDEESVILDTEDGLGKAVEDLIAEHPGEESIEGQIHLADYYQYYSISVDWQLEELGYYRYGDSSEGFEGADRENCMEEDYLAWTIGQYLKIPVIDDEYEDLIIETDGEEICSVSTSVADNADEFDFNTESFTTDDAIYFTFDNRSLNGDPVDTSLIPGGYGIYKIPYSVDEDADATDGENVTIEVEDMSTVYSSPENETILDMSRSRDGSKILLITNTDDCYYAKILDSTDFSVLGEMKIADQTRSSAYVSSIQDDCGLLLNLNDEKICFIQEDDEENYSIQILADEAVIDDDEETAVWYSGLGYSLAYDGERLAVVGSDELDMETDNITYTSTGAGMIVTVYTNDGLAYLGHISCSLTDSNWLLDEDGQYAYDSCDMVEPDYGEKCTGYFQ